MRIPNYEFVTLSGKSEDPLTRYFQYFNKFMDYYPAKYNTMSLNSLKKAELLTEAKRLAQLNADLTFKYDQTLSAYYDQKFAKNDLHCKIQKITQAISERFDADGVDDITLPKKITWVSILFSLGSVTKLIKEIIHILKTPCNEDTNPFELTQSVA